MADSTVALSLVLMKLREADLSGASNKLMSLRDRLQSAVGTLPSHRFIIRREEIDPRIKLLIEDINELAYKVEDMIDDILLEVHRKRMLREPFHKRLRYALNPSLSPIFPLKARKQIRDISVMAEHIRQSMADLGEHDMSTDGDGAITPQGSTTPSPLRLRLLHRLDEHVSSMGRVLITHAGPISVVAVVGMAGIGKTTLARRFFDNAHLMLRLDDNAVGAWLSLGGNSSTPLTGSLKFKFVGDGHGDHDQLKEERLVGDDLVERVREVLERGSRYVFVIDNMRRTVQWEQLERALPIPVSMLYRSFVLITIVRIHWRNDAHVAGEITKQHTQNSREQS